MTPEMFQRVRDAVEAARALPEPARADYIAGLEQEIRSEVMDLLSYENEAAAVDQPLVPSMADADALPLSVGKYQLVSPLGEGGMGRVYLARQQHPQREVAVKVVRSGVLSRSVLRRFEIESELLGQLQHPGIAQILEAGVAEVRYADGRVVLQPYYAMEYVRGVPLIAHADRRRLDVRARMALAADVADAVEHAHRRGIIHRDLKPANILVGEDGKPKILDFGVARALRSDLRATTQTNAGQIVGTLAYMSPEQTLGDSREIDTRSDVYSLGVILYELLTGRLPLDVTSLPLPEAARAIREDEPTRAGSLIAQLRGDVETITAKAIEKDRERRYQSAGALAADLRRFLADEPIFARPASTLYQLRKFAKRNKALVGGVIATMVVLAAGIAGTSIAAARASKQKEVAEKRGREADRSAYRAMIAAAQAGIEAGDGPLVRRSLDHANPEMRGWEWSYLAGVADRSLVKFEGAGGKDCRLAADPGGLRLACISADSRLQVYNATTGKALWPEPKQLPRPANAYGSLEFAPRSYLLIFTEAGTGIRAVDARTGEDRWSALGEGVWACRGSPNGTQIAAIARSGPDLVLVSTADGSVVGKVPMPSFAHEFAGFSATGDEVTVMTFVNRSNWRHWTLDLRSGAAREEQVGPSSLHWRLPGGRFVGAVKEGAEFRLADHATGRDLGRGRTIIPKDESLVALAPDGSRLAWVENGTTLKLQDVEASTFLCAEHLPSAATRLTFLTPTRIAAALEDGSVRVWDARMPPAPLTFQTSAVRATVFSRISPGANRVLVSDWGTLAWWDARTGRRLSSLHVGPTLPLAISTPTPDGRYPVLTQQGTVIIVSTEGDRLSMVSSARLAPDGMLRWAAWTPDASVLRVVTEQGRVVDLDPGTGAARDTRAYEGLDMLIAEDGERLAVADEEGVKLLRRSDFSQIWRHPRRGLMSALPAGAISPSGERLGVAARGSLLLLNISDGAAAAEWSDTDTGSVAAAWTPDARRFVVLSESSTLRCFNPENGDEVAAIRTSVSRGGRLAFSTDAARLVVTGLGQACVLEVKYDPSLSEERELVRRLAEILDPLYERFRLAGDVAAAVREMPGLDESLREECLRQVEIRGIDINRLNERAWSVASDATSGAAERDEAVRYARACAAAAPHRWDTLNTLALAELRAGDAGAALAVNDRCLEMYRKQPGGEHPADLAVRALVLATLGRGEEMRDVLARLAALPGGAGESPEIKRMADEARKVLEGAKPRPG